jgi:hypothetical protein
MLIPIIVKKVTGTLTCFFCKKILMSLYDFKEILLHEYCNLGIDQKSIVYSKKNSLFTKR